MKLLFNDHSGMRSVLLSQFFSVFGNTLLCVSLAVKASATEISDWIIVVGFATLIIPTALVSSLGGDLADRQDKAGLIRLLRLTALFLAPFAAIGLVTEHLLVVLGTLAALGAVSALLGPARCAILPDRLEAPRLPGVNALANGVTVGAIVVGIVSGSMLMSLKAGSLLIALLVPVASALSWSSVKSMPSSGPAMPGLKVQINPIASGWHLLGDLRSNRRLWRVALARAWSWIATMVVLTLLPGLVYRVQGGEAAMHVLLSAALACVAIGVAIGSGLAAFLAGGRVILASAPIGCILLGCALLVAWYVTRGLPPSPSISIGFSLFFAAIGAGLLAVPTQVAAQAWSAPAYRGRVVGAANVVAALGVTLAVCIELGARAAGLNEPTLLGFIGLISMPLGLTMLKLPANPVGEVLWICYRILFRVEVTGLQNLPQRGEVVLITPNHTSWLDAGLIMAMVEEQPLFVVDTQTAKFWWVRPALRLVSWFPVESAGSHSLRTMITALSAGKSMVIFPEGRLTITGSLMEILPGTGTVADRAHAAIVPVHHQGLERTPFSRHTRKQTRRAVFPKVTATVFPARPLSVADGLVGRARRSALTDALRDIMEESVYLSRLGDDTLFEAVARSGRRHGMSRLAVQDPASGALSYRKLLAGADVLGGKIIAGTDEREVVGLLLPTSNAAALCVLGLGSYGRTAAMMNATSGLRALRAGVQAAKIRTLVTSRAFVEKAKLVIVVDQLRQDVRIVFLEDVRLDVTRADRIRGLLRVTIRTTVPRVARTADDRAVVVFTSGSSGTPKGVVLTHRNLLSNVAQVAGRIGFGPDDKVLNPLPMFHAFGLMGGFLLPVVNGIPVFLYPSPLHYSIVPIVAYNWNATVIFGTSVFLKGYARRAMPTAFHSLRLAVAGAARVSPAVHDVWMEKFGVRILEGYGVTECSPVVAVNTLVSNRSGTVGRLLPGMQMRLDAITHRDDSAGRLLVRGPNVMLGYLKADMPGVLQPPDGGWYDTSDIVSIDHAQHLRIHGRLTRTARLGGEMVSLEAVEDIAADLWPDAMSVAVTVPDPRKDERVVLLTDKTGANRENFNAGARALGAPEVMLPAEVRVLAKLPLLGTGKPDYMAATKLVLSGESMQYDMD